MKRILASIGGGLAVLGMSWLLGFDFDERGLAAFVTAYCAIAIPAAIYTFPGWKK